MPRAESVRTFEELRNRISGDAASKLKPLTAAQIEKLRPRVLEANDRYHATAGDEGGPVRDADDLVDGLRHLAAMRTPGGNVRSAFERALEEVFVDVAEVA